MTTPLDRNGRAGPPMKSSLVMLMPVLFNLSAQCPSNPWQKDAAVLENLPSVKKMLPRPVPASLHLIVMPASLMSLLPTMLTWLAPINSKDVHDRMGP